MEKVTVSKQVAEGLERLRDTAHWPNKTIIECVLHPKSYHESWEQFIGVLRNLPFDDFINILYVGYEVEQTPEEKVQVWVKTHIKIANENSEFVGMRSAHMVDGARDVLNLLNIKIDGVNT